MTYRSGWAYGDRGTTNGQPSEWLTILGSAHVAPVLWTERAQAELALRENVSIGRASWLNIVVAHVTEIPHGGVSGRGYAYRITTGASAS